MAQSLLSYKATEMSHLLRGMSRRVCLTRCWSAMACKHKWVLSLRS